MYQHADDIVKGNINPRILTKFFNSIKYIKDFSDKENLAYIRDLANGAADGSFGGLFIEFIHNNLDKLVSPEEILTTKDWKTVDKKLKEAIVKDEKNEVHIAALLSFRFGNYVVKASKQKKLAKEHVDRIYEFYTSGYLTDDMQYAMMSKIAKADKRVFYKYPDLSKHIIGEE